MAYVKEAASGKTLVELWCCLECGWKVLLRIAPKGVLHAPSAMMACFRNLALQLRLDDCVDEAEREEVLGWSRALQHGPSGEAVLRAYGKLLGHRPERIEDEVEANRRLGLLRSPSC
jgi:hypothetical protein